MMFLNHSLSQIRSFKDWIKWVEVSTNFLSIVQCYAISPHDKVGAIFAHYLNGQLWRVNESFSLVGT